MFFNRKKRSLIAVYKMHSIDSSAFSLVGIFIPIYFLTLGYSLKQVIIYFIIQNTFLLVSSFAAGYLGSKYGIQKTLVLRLPFLFTFLVLLMGLDGFKFPIYFLAVLDGWQSALYWIPLNIVFAKNTSKKSSGSSVSKLFALPELVNIFTPIIGALVAAYFGFNILFAITIIIFVFSVMPLFSIKRIDVKFKFKFKNGNKLFKKNKKYFFSEMLNNIGEEVDGIIWPIFI